MHSRRDDALPPAAPPTAPLPWPQTLSSSPLYRRVPKLKHFPLVNQKHFTVLNVSALKELKDGSTVNLDSLVKDGIVTSPKHPLKMLGNGELTVKNLTVQASAFTASARTKIEAAGGTCETLD